MSGLTFQDNLHIIAKRGDNQVNFQAVRQDSSNPVSYSAWLSSEGGYIIMKQDRTDPSDVTLKYFYSKVSTEAFQTAWDARAAKTYIEYNALFT